MREALSNNGWSADDQMADVVSWLSHDVGFRDVSDRFEAEFPEYNSLVWGGSHVDTEASGVDPEYTSWVIDWIEDNTPVFWEDGEPWIDEDVNELDD